MKHVLLLVPALLFANAAAAVECDFIRAETILAQPMEEGTTPDEEFEVLQQQSAEGGFWSVMNGSDGKPQLISRKDMGETGRSELDLAVEQGGTYVIRQRTVHYAGPIGTKGSLGIREEASYFRFCDRVLDWPADLPRDETYDKAARAAAAEFFSAPEVAKTLIAAGLKPPLWK